MKELFGGFFEHKILYGLFGVSRATNADAESMEVLGPERFDNRLHAPVSGTAGAVGLAELTFRQIDIIVDNPQVSGIDLGVFKVAMDCPTRLIHKRHRFYQKPKVTAGILAQGGYVVGRITSFFIPMSRHG
jgi:hypothetical protein